MFYIFYCMCFYIQSGEESIQNSQCIKMRYSLRKTIVLNLNPCKLARRKVFILLIDRQARSSNTLIQHNNIIFAVSNLLQASYMRMKSFHLIASDPLQASSTSSRASSTTLCLCHKLLLRPSIQAQSSSMTCLCYQLLPRPKTLEWRKGASSIRKKPARELQVSKMSPLNKPFPLLLFPIVHWNDHHHLLAQSKRHGIVAP